MLLAVAVVAAAVAGAATLVDRRSGAAERAPAWLWAQGAEPGEPIAFALVRDFELPPRDDGAARTGTLATPYQQASLLVAADAEVTVLLNDLWLGGVDRAAPADLDLAALSDPAPLPTAHFDVAVALRPGRNRIYLEVSSENGSGAVLAELRLAAAVAGAEEAAAPVVERLWSDGAWRVARRTVPGLRAGWLELERAEAVLEPPHVWGTIGAGRYRDPRTGVEPAGVGIALRQASSRWALGAIRLDDARADGVGGDRASRGGGDPAAATGGANRGAGLKAGTLPGGGAAAGSDPAERHRLRFEPPGDGASAAAAASLELFFAPGSGPTWLARGAETLEATAPMPLDRGWKRLLRVPGELSWRSPRPLRADEVVLRGALPTSARLVVTGPPLAGVGNGHPKQAAGRR
ncbi:MAG: hypothetical protein DWQ36_22435 [Acidobacteria bacterium]|nr:MAG: hypothetical protein DWQ30_13835 [Acidobacteriota bacterium]REK00523.1 MAG: hypothetical protein DWQ36_22435 [Acidobacteriota bacterium]